MECMVATWLPVMKDGMHGRHLMPERKDGIHGRYLNTWKERWNKLKVLECLKERIEFVVGTLMSGRKDRMHGRDLTTWKEGWNAW